MTLHSKARSNTKHLATLWAYKPDPGVHLNYIERAREKMQCPPLSPDSSPRLL